MAWTKFGVALLVGCALGCSGGDGIVGGDAGPLDVELDAGPPDTGPPDTGPLDTGPADTGPADTGPRPCRDNIDCAANEFGFHVCDPSSGMCVQCTAAHHAAGAS